MPTKAYNSPEQGKSRSADESTTESILNVDTIKSTKTSKRHMHMDIKTMLSHLHAASEDSHCTAESNHDCSMQHNGNFSDPNRLVKESNLH